MTQIKYRPLSDDDVKQIIQEYTTNDGSSIDEFYKSLELLPTGTIVLKSETKYVPMSITMQDFNCRAYVLYNGVKVEAVNTVYFYSGDPDFIIMSEYFVQKYNEMVLQLMEWIETRKIEYWGTD